MGLMDKPRNPWHRLFCHRGLSHQSFAMAQATLATEPLVSVVTPFYNTAPYLAECIESVLKQSYTHFEYILMDNCSTDGSADIAEGYALRDPRIRLVRCSQFLSQAANYNRALAAISDASKYTKIVQADDWIFPDCLQLMVQTFEQSESIGLVSSYWLSDEQNAIGGSGYPVQTPMLSGRECAQWYLRTGIYIFGSQTTVMYRSSLVRRCESFYDGSLSHADLDKCMEILEHWDFGFVYQVLSFTRRENESIISKQLSFEGWWLWEYINTQRYAPVFLEAGEAVSVRRKSKRKYYRALARAVLRLKRRPFWQYHKVGLKTLSENETLDWPYLMLQVGIVLLWVVSNPGRTILRMVHYCKRTAELKGLLKSTQRNDTVLRIRSKFT
jgi:glycosyltransferase involved in cell wall biosynthesis